MDIFKPPSGPERPAVTPASVRSSHPRNSHKDERAWAEGPEDAESVEGQVGLDERSEKQPSSPVASGTNDWLANHTIVSPKADGTSPMKRVFRTGGGAGSLLRTTLPTPRSALGNRFNLGSGGPGSALRASLAMSPGLWNPRRGAPISATRGGETEEDTLPLDADAAYEPDEEETEASRDRERDSMLVFSSPQHTDLTQQLGLAPGSILRSSNFGFPTPGNLFETPLRTRGGSSGVGGGISSAGGSVSRTSRILLDDVLWPTSVRPTPLGAGPLGPDSLQGRMSEEPESPVLSSSQRRLLSLPATLRKGGSRSVCAEEADADGMEEPGAQNADTEGGDSKPDRPERAQGNESADMHEGRQGTQDEIQEGDDLTWGKWGKLDHRLTSTPLAVSTPLARDSRARARNREWSARSPLRATPLRSTPLWSARPPASPKSSKSTATRGHKDQQEPDGGHVQSQAQATAPAPAQAQAQASTQPQALSPTQAHTRRPKPTRTPYKSSSFAHSPPAKKRHVPSSYSPSSSRSSASPHFARSPRSPRSPVSPGALRSTHSVGALRSPARLFPLGSGNAGNVPGSHITGGIASAASPGGQLGKARADVLPPRPVNVNVPKISAELSSTRGGDTQ